MGDFNKKWKEFSNEETSNGDPLTDDPIQTFLKFRSSAWKDEGGGPFLWYRPKSHKKIMFMVYGDDLIELNDKYGVNLLTPGKNYQAWGPMSLHPKYKEQIKNYIRKHDLYQEKTFNNPSNWEA